MDVFGLIGNPVGHSLSPQMHEAAYEACDMDARYVTFEPEQGRVGDVVASAETLGLSGLNVTIPFKQAVMEHLDVEEMAQRIGAVNTIDFSVSPPQGFNTDAAGVRRSLERHDVTLAERDAVVVGAGGAARAIAFVLSEAGARVHIANRTVERAASLAEDVEAVSGTGVVRAGGLDTLERAVPDADLLVHATSVGMETEESLVPASALHGDLVVMDAVYSPLETRLLRDATAAGAQTVDGAWMLLYQGVEAFERWTDQPAPVEAMSAALREEI